MKALASRHKNVDLRINSGTTSVAGRWQVRFMFDCSFLLGDEFASAGMAQCGQG
jgi:hypothetical protein